MILSTLLITIIFHSTVLQVEPLGIILPFHRPHVNHLVDSQTSAFRTHFCRSPKTVLYTERDGEESRVKNESEDLSYENFGKKTSNGEAEEMQLYTEMYNELNKGEMQVYEDILGDLKGVKLPEDIREESVGPITSRTLEVVDDVSAINISSKNEVVIDRAIKEALSEARKITDASEEGDSEIIPSDISPSSIREDKELMIQIDALFDKASKELMASAEAIRREQAALTQQNEEFRQAKVKDERERLTEAEKSVTSLINNMKKEADHVQVAMKELEDIRSKASNDPLLQISNFRELNFMKKSAFAGSLLFFIRAILELPEAIGSSSHGVAALIQFGIAFLCAALFVAL